MIAMYLRGLEPWLPYALALLFGVTMVAAGTGSVRRAVVGCLAVLVIASAIFVALHRGPLDPERQFPLRQRDLALIERELTYRDHITEYAITLLEQSHQLDLAALRQHYEPELESWRQRYAEATQDLAPVTPAAPAGPTPSGAPVSPPAAVTPAAPAPAAAGAPR